MRDVLERETKKLQALSEMLMYMEGEPVPKGMTALLDDIANNLGEITKQIPTSEC